MSLSVPSLFAQYNIIAIGNIEAKTRDINSSAMNLYASNAPLSNERTIEMTKNSGMHIIGGFVKVDILSAICNLFMLIIYIIIKLISIMKMNLKPRAMMYPAPAVVASAYDEENNPDCCTLAFAAMCSHHPPAVMIAINTTLKRKTLKSILKTKEFCLAFPSIEHVSETDYFGIESGYNEDKLSKVGFSFKDAEFVHAPIIDEFKVSLECRAIHIAKVGSHTQITGEIVNIQADEDAVDKKGKVVFEKLNPLSYDDVTHAYYGMGERIADAFKAGLKYR